QHVQSRPRRTAPPVPVALLLIGRDITHTNNEMAAAWPPFLFRMDDADAYSASASSFLTIRSVFCAATVTSVEMLAVVSSLSTEADTLEWPAHSARAADADRPSTAAITRTVFMLSPSRV